MTMLGRMGAAAQQGRRRVMGAGGVAPTITAAPVLTWTVEIGTSPAITPPTYTGDAGTITYTLKRDGVNVSGMVGVSEATLEAYVATASDIGPDLDVEATVTNGSGSDSEISNAVVFDDAAYLPARAIWVSQEGRTDVSGAADVWVSSYGGLAATLTAYGATSRPPVNATGGVGSRPLITPDGVNDGMGQATFTKGSSWTTYECSATGHRVAFVGANNRILVQEGSSSHRWGLVDQSATSLAGRVIGGSQIASTSDPDGADAIWSMDSASGTQNTRKNGTVEATASTTTPSFSDGESIAYGSRTGGTLGANFATQALAFGAALTTDQRTHEMALIKYLTGIGP